MEETIQMIVNGIRRMKDWEGGGEGASLTKKMEGGRKAKGVTSSRAAVGLEGWLNVIKEGGGTPSCNPFPSPARLHLFQIRKI